MRPLCEGGLPVRFNSRLLDDLPMALDEELVLNMWCWSPFAGCVAAINALTGVNVFAQAFLIPVGVVFYGAMRTLSDVQCMVICYLLAKKHIANQRMLHNSLHRRTQVNFHYLVYSYWCVQARLVEASGNCTCNRMPVLICVPCPPQ